MAEVSTGESTISDYVSDYRNLRISFDKLHLKDIQSLPNKDGSGYEDVLFAGDNVWQKYTEDLEDLVITKTYDRDERRRYICNPWALSYDLYGTTEFWHMLLDLNGVPTALEFRQTKVKVYDQSLREVVDAIMSQESTAIRYNNAEEEKLSLANVNEDDSGISEEE